MAYAHKIENQKTVRLADYDPRDTDGIDREQAEAKMPDMAKEMDELNELLFAAGHNGLLIVLQGMDTSGKDGTIRHILQHTNVQNCRVVAFKAPTPEQLAHDFLWRVHAQVPGRSDIVLFNRSHYEDVIAVRVRQLVPEDVWKRRYAEINDFERLLVNSGTIVLKFFLHISKSEQEQRLLDREKDPLKAWKLNVDDWRDRVRWNDFQSAYEDALAKCGTADAPWYIVPADRKWFRNFAVTDRILQTLRPCRKEWMKVLEERGAKAKRELAEYRVGGGK